jgi:hypothetical protein
MNRDGVGLAYDAKSAATVKLSNGMVLYLRHINRFLAIVCIMKEECLERQVGPVPRSPFAFLNLLLFSFLFLFSYSDMSIYCLFACFLFLAYCNSGF